jgi:site-specific DNA-cytosine methylase
MGKNKGRCLQHPGGKCKLKRHCPAPGCFDELVLLCSGFSCKTWSFLNALSGSMATAMADSKDTESSVATFHATKNGITIVLPHIFLLENVDNMGSEDNPKSNIACVLDNLREINEDGVTYLVTYTTLNCKDFYLPQDRKRIFIMGVRSDLPRSREVLQHWVGRVQNLKHEHLPVDCFLYESDEACVEAELARRLDSISDKSATRIIKPDGTKKWMPVHADLAEKRGQKWPLADPSHLKENAWFGLAPQREKEIVAWAEEDRMRWVDSSQTATRARGVHTDVPPTMTPGQHLWSSLRQRYILGRESLGLQGYPHTRLAKLGHYSELNLMDISGNAFPSTLVMASLMAALLIVTHGDDEEETR